MDVAPRERAAETAREDDRALHARLLAGDPLAGSDLAVAHLGWLSRWLGRRFPNVDPDLLGSVAIDLVLALPERPAQYDPTRGSLMGYLKMAADGDVRNALQRERRRAERQVALEDVELSEWARNTRIEGAPDPAEEVARAEPARGERSAAAGSDTQGGRLMTALWVHETADHFWTWAGGATDAFPRDLQTAIAWALPVAVVELPGLSIAAVDRWLAARGMQVRLRLPDRGLRACVLAHDGDGLLFLDATDGEDERRFSLAHEVAHYLVEYALPRERARERLGSMVLPVLDGHRPPSREERIGATLAGVRLDVRLHLMERTPDGHLPDRGVSAAERRADELAFELLAPIEAVRARLPAGASRAAVVAALGGTFGLPPVPAAAYARQLAPSPPDGSLFRRLFSVV